MLIFDLCVEHEYLLQSEHVSQFDKMLFEKMTKREATIEELSNGLFSAYSDVISELWAAGYIIG